LFVDSTDRVWIAFRAALGVVCCEGEKVRTFNGDGKMAVEVKTICETPGGTVWFATQRNGVFGLRQDVLWSLTQKDGLANDRIGNITTVRSGDLWIASGNYLQVLRTDQRNTLSLPVRIPAKSVTSFIEDREGSVWLCADDDGFIRMRQAPYRSVTVAPESATNNIQSVTEDAAGNTWAAVQYGGVIKISPANNVTTTGDAEGLPGPNAWVVYGTRDGSVWGGMRDGLAVSRQGVNETFPEIRSVRTIYEDRNGDLLVGTAAEGVFRYHDKKFTPVGREAGRSIWHATAFAEKNDGTLLIGTWEHGLYRVNHDKLDVYNHDNGLPSDRIRAVYVDRDDRIWVGTKGRGLAVYDQGRWLNPNTFSESFADQVTAIIEDGRGRLWLGTSLGIMWAMKDELLAVARGEKAAPTLHVAGISDGSHVTPVWSGGQPVVWRTKDRRLLFATQRGVIAIDPDHLPLNEAPPPVHIVNLAVDRKIVRSDGEIVMPAGTREVTIDYAALSFLQPSRNLFKYKLDGYDPDWVDAGTRRTAYYTNLPHGRYVFRVKACNSEGVWNEDGDRVTLVQQPHFYQTWWFTGCVLVGIAGAGFGLNRWSHRQLMFKLERLEQRQAMEKERRRIAKNLHDDLGANLTEIGLFAESVRRKSEPAEIRRDLNLLFDKVQSVAANLDTVVWAVNPANDSLDRLTTYVCELFHELFQRSEIRPRVELIGDIPAHPLTPEERSNLFLTAKEAMNNILKHSGATEAWLRIKMEGSVYVLTLEDNGRGFDVSAPKNEHRNGLGNMSSRMAELGGRCVLQSTPGAGTRIALTLPFAVKGRLARNEPSHRKNVSTPAPHIV
jgi:signal transduction histidine kinase